VGAAAIDLGGLSLAAVAAAYRPLEAGAEHVNALQDLERVARDCRPPKQAPGLTVSDLVRLLDAEHELRVGVRLTAARSPEEEALIDTRDELIV
jgi:hypothetical protein